MLLVACFLMKGVPAHRLLGSKELVLALRRVGRPSELAV
jgi:hypothetical protein